MILKMKRVTVYAMRQYRDQILKELQRRSIMMIEESDGTAPDGRLDEAQRSLADARDAIGFLAPYSTEKVGLLTPLPEVSVQRMEEKTDGSQQQQADASVEALKIKDRLSAIGTQRASDMALIKQTQPWEECALTVEQLEGTETAELVTGYLPTNMLALLSEQFSELPAEIVTYKEQASYTAVCIVRSRSCAEQTDDILRDAGFMAYRFVQSSGTAADYISELKADIEKLDAEAQQLTDRAKELGKLVPELKLFYDSKAATRDRYSAPCASTQSTFYITGWVTEERCDELRQAVASVTDVFSMEIRDASPEEQAPTLVRNSKAVQPFETLTDMFSRPNPREGIDPNPVMAPWYWVIFGMMMADVGYGLAMAVIFTVYLKIKKPRGEMGKLVRVLLFASITTAFWGVMFGSYFGETFFPAVLFVPLDDPISFLVLALAVGVIHIFCGLVLHAIQLIKQGRVQEAIGCDFGWMLLISGLPLMLLPGLGTVGTVCTLVGLGLIVLFTKGSERNVFKRVLGGLSSLTGITNYMSDILSYSRIVALMLASGVVAMVMNILAGMVMDIPVVGIIFSLAVYLAGHVFNLVMGLLSAYVHASRLQYIEFYSKFYEGGGYGFTPLSYNTTYSVVSEEENKPSKSR